MHWLTKFFFACLLLSLAGCGSARPLFYRNLDNSGDLFISHQIQSFPILGPCGFIKKSDEYSITTPRTNNKIEAIELDILKFSSDTSKCDYTGHIEFKQNNIIFIELYAIKKGVKNVLTINGTYKIKVKDNKIKNKRV